MNKLKAFAHIYKNSISRFEYYKKVLETSLNFSVKYFLVLTLVASLLVTIRTSVDAIPRVRVMVYNILNEISAVYPRDLEITSSNGTWSINKQEPYGILMPDLNDDNDFVLPEYLVIFDHDGTLNDLKDKDTLMIVNAKNIIVENINDRIEIYPLEGLPDGKFNREMLDKGLGNVRLYLGTLPVLLSILIFLGVLYYFIFFRFLYLLFVALLLLAAGVLLKGLKLKYKDYLKLAIHTFTLPLTLEVIFSIAGISYDVTPWFIGLNVIFGVAIIYNLNIKSSYKELAVKEILSEKEE